MAARASPLNPALRFVDPNSGLLTTEGFRFLQAIRQAAVASQVRTGGDDDTLVTGTAGSSGDFGNWDADGNLVGISPAATLVAIGAQPLGSYQPLDADLTAWAAVNPSAYLNTAGIAAAYQPLDATLTALAVSDFGTSAPVTKTADFTVGPTENFIISDRAATNTATLPAAASFTGRILTLKTIQAQTVVSATSNVVPLAGGAAATAILAATAGKWAILVSDGTNWVIMAGN